MGQNNNNNNDNLPEKKKACDDAPQQSAERIKKDIAGVFPSREDEKKLDEDIHKMIVTRESAERIAGDLAGHITSEITGFADMLKASTQNVRLVEEKMSRLAREMEDIRKSGANEAFGGRMSKLEAFASVQNEKLSKQDEANRVLGEKLSKLEEQVLPRQLERMELASRSLGEKLSKQEELGRAVLSVMDDFKARMGDYPTRGEMEPLWKEAETVMLDDMNRQRSDLKALLAALDDDYKDGAISEKTYRETKGKTEEKLAALEDKMKKFVEAAAERGRAGAEGPARATMAEKEKLAEAKLAELEKREARLSLVEKKLEGFSQQSAALAQALGSNSGRLADLDKKLDASSRQAASVAQATALRSGELEKKLEESSKQMGSFDKKLEESSKQAASLTQAATARIGELETKLETISKQAEASGAKRISEVEKKLDDSVKLTGGRMADLEKKLAELPKQAEASGAKRISEVEKKLDDSVKLTGGRMADFEKKLAELPKGRLSMAEQRLGELAGRIEELKAALSSTDNRMRSVERGLPLLSSSLSSSSLLLPESRKTGGGLLSRILGGGKESGEIRPIAAVMPEAAWRAEKPRAPAGIAEKTEEPEKIKVELEAPFAAAITPSPLHAPEEKKEKVHLKAELESLEAMLGRLKERQKPGGHETITITTLSKLRNQKAELEGLLKMVEKRHSEGAIENSSYGEIRKRTLDRLSKINGLLLLGQKAR